MNIQPPAKLSAHLPERANMHEPEGLVEVNTLLAVLRYPRDESVIAQANGLPNVRFEVSDN